MEVQTFCPINI